MKIKKLLISFCILFLCFLEACSPSLKNDTDLVSGQLANGLRYLIYPNSYPKDLVSLRLVLKVGSLMENDNQQGIAHFIEHMLFNGTQSFPHQNLVTFLESQGMRFGADLNAYTSFDQTVYELDIQNPKESGTHLKTALKIMREWLRYASFEEKDIEKERGIILQEKLLHEGFSQRYSLKILQSLYEGTLFSQRLPIGKEELIKNFKREDFLSFYNQWYRPQRATLIISGDNLDIQQLKSLIEQQFADLENANKTEEQAVNLKVNQIEKSLRNLKNPYKSDTFVCFADEEVKYANLLMVQRIPTGKESLNPLSEEKLVKHSLVWLFERRFKEILDKAVPLPYQNALMGEDIMAGYLYDTPILANIYQLSLFQGQEKIGLKVFFQEWERLLRYGFTQGEWDLCQQTLLHEANRAYDNRDKRSSQDLARQLISMSLGENSYFPSPQKTFEIVKNFFSNYTLKRINSALFQALSGDNWLYFYSYSPQNNSSLSEQEILTIRNEAKTLDLEPYVLEVNRQLSGKIFEEPISLPSAELISASSGFYSWNLENGIRIYFKPSSRVPKTLFMRAAAWGLFGLENAQQWKQVSWGSVLVNQSGWGNLTRAQTQQFLVDKNLSLGTTYDLEKRVIEGHFDWDCKDDFFHCLWALVRLAKIDQSTQEEYKQKIKEAIFREQKDFKTPFRRAIRKALYANNPFIFDLSDLESEFENGDIQNLLSFYQEQFNDLSQFSFVFVGDIDQKELIRLTTQYLGALDIRKREQKSEVKDYLPYSERRYEQNLYLDPEERATAFLSFTNNQESLNFSFNREEEQILRQALELAYSRVLLEQVREKISGVYSISLSVLNDSFPTKQKDQVQILYVSSPEQLTYVTQVVKEVIKQTQRKGFSPEIIDYLRKYLLKIYKKAYDENDYWLDYALCQCLYQGNWQHMSIEQYMDIINSDNLQKMANKLIVWESLKELYLLPKGKK